MNTLQKTVKGLDTFQQRYRLTSFSYAVVKKYGNDKAGYQAALLTYYGFLALFPLLLVLTTVVGLLANHDPGLQKTLIASLTNYFPSLGSQLSAHVHTIHKSGVALIVGIVLTLYGSKGVADAFRNGMYTIWRVPAKQRPGFPKSTVASLSIIIVGGIGFIAASLLAGYAGAVGHGILFRLLSLAVNLVILYALFTVLLRISLPKRTSFAHTNLGAISAAIGLVLLQSVGSYLLARELKNLDSLYSTFAIALGLLFWIYLQAQVLYYAVEISTVSVFKLWPRSLDSSHPTAVDVTETKRLSVINDANIL